MDTPGGRFHAEWDVQAPVTREGRLVFFFQFLHAGGRWEEFLRNCPLSHTGNRGSGACNVLGTAMPGILCGHWRYAHINAVRGDGINPGLLGMKGTVSEDAVRLGIGRIGQKEGLAWLGGHILESISPALGLPWILDIDVTIKPLYGHQQGAQIGYNPQKPGRPSHVYHSYFVANLRICLGVEVRPGKEHAAARGLPALWETPAKLPRHQWPAFSRGDCGHGSESVIIEHEERGLPYLFKLRHTKKVKELVRRMMREGAGWDACATPWSGKIAVLVTSLDERAFPTVAMPRHYRERADAENCFDELKNQRGWAGYTSRRFSSSQIMANFIALVYNWWSLYLRFYDGGIIARPSGRGPC